MKNTQYINIQGWMVNELKLKSNELIAYAVIYGFSQDGSSKFTGSLKYLESCLGVSKNTVLNAIKGLVEKGFIRKETNTINNIKFCSYSHIELVVQNLVIGSAKTAPGGSAKTAPNNTIINNTNIIKGEKKIFPQAINDCLSNCLVHFPEHLHPKNKTTWLNTIDKLERIDKIPLQIIEEIVKKTRLDSFWSKNFLSLKKLRSKDRHGTMYISIFAELIKSNNKTINPTQNEEFQRYTSQIRANNPNL